MHASPILNDNGDYIGGVAGVIDITQQKKSEDEQARLNGELNRRVEELEDFYQMAIGRELKMKELKEEINQLRSELSKYKK